MKASQELVTSDLTQGLREQLDAIEQKYGIKIGMMPTPTIWAEDPGILLGKNRYLVANFDIDGNVIKSLDALRQYNLPEAAPSAGRPVRRPSNSPLAVTEAEETAKNLVNAGYEVQQSQLLLEGGNVLSTGYRTIIGRAGLIANMELLKARGKLDEGEVQNLATKTKWPENELDLARTMIKNKRTVDGNQTLTPEILEAEANKMLARMEITKGGIASELNILPRNLVIVSQPTFHIDMQLRPIDDNTILVNDPRLSNKLIDDVLSQPGLDPKEIKALNDMKYPPEELEKLSAVLDRTRRELEEAGFKVIPKPGTARQAGMDAKGLPYDPSISSKSPSPSGTLAFVENPDLGPSPVSLNMNVMNGVIGKTPSGEVLYLTNSTGMPALDKAQETWFKQNTPVGNIEFLNHSLLDHEGGFDCITFG